MTTENRALVAFIALVCIALGSAVTYGIDRINAPKPVIISDAVNVPPQLPPPPSSSSASDQNGGLPTDRAHRSGKRSRTARGASSGRSVKKITKGVIHINSATVDQLEELPGVGPSTAQAIVDFRTQSGGFQSIDELGDIPRMGAKKLQRLQPFVAL
jgi:competence ComEA-like helix-hairpin-helix protein